MCAQVQKANKTSILATGIRSSECETQMTTECNKNLLDIILLLKWTSDKTHIFFECVYCFLLFWVVFSPLSFRFYTYSVESCRNQSRGSTFRSLDCCKCSNLGKHFKFNLRSFQIKQSIFFMNCEGGSHFLMTFLSGKLIFMMKTDLYKKLNTLWPQSLLF